MDSKKTSTIQSIIFYKPYTLKSVRKYLKENYFSKPLEIQIIKSKGKICFYKVIFHFENDFIKLSPRRIQKSLELIIGFTDMPSK